MYKFGHRLFYKDFSILEIKVTLISSCLSKATLKGRREQWVGCSWYTPCWQYPGQSGVWANRWWLPSQTTVTEGSSADGVIIILNVTYLQLISYVGRNISYVILVCDLCIPCPLLTLLHTILWHITLITRITHHPFCLETLVSQAGSRFNIKNVFPGMAISIIKIIWSWDRLIFIMVMSILARRHLYIEIPIKKFHDFSMTSPGQNPNFQTHKKNQYLFLRPMYQFVE